MDAAFQTEWLKLLAHLGPVFSYFVACLWDKEVSNNIHKMAQITKFELFL